MSIQVQKKLWLSFWLLNWLIIFWFWWQGSGAQLFTGLAGTLIALGKLFGLVLAITVLTQFLFMGRMPWLERVFGLDKLSKIHHTNGRYSFIFLILHPLLLTAGFSLILQINPFKQFWLNLSNSKELVWASIGFVLFLIVIASSIYVVRKRLRYESWYFVHLAVYLAVFLSFPHQIKLGEDLLASKVFFSYWIGLYILVFGSHIIFRFCRPIYFFQKHKFKVARIHRENHNTVSIYITGQNLNQFKIQSGQFMIFRFLTKGMWWQAHPFSLSMLPNGQELRITVKELGDFTGIIKNLMVGTKIIIDGPYGVFTDFFSTSSKALLVAGGIGITPIRSLVEEMLQKGKQVILLYSAKTLEDVVFKQELENLQVEYSMFLTYIMTNDDSYEGERGHINEEKIIRLVPDIKERDVYICGPVPMMNSLIEIMKTAQVPDSQIHFEKFSLA